MTNTELLMSILAGIALSACCGFRVFVPLLVAACGLRFGLLPPEWLSDAAVQLIRNDVLLAGLTIATVLELVAYKIPYIDNALDAIATPLAILAATLLSSSFFTFADEPYLRFILGAVTGGLGAGIIQTSTTAARAGTTQFTFGLGNPFFALFESVAAFVGSVIALLFPIFAVVMMVAFCWACIWLFRRLARRRI